MTGFKIIRVGSASTSRILCETGMIDFQPQLRYRVEKRNAFDPTYIHRREPFHEDKFTLKAILTPAQYTALLAILNAEGTFYLVYTSAGIDLIYPVTADNLPKCSDDLHEYTDETSLSFTSRYTDYSPVIPPLVTELTSFDETLTIS